MAASVSFSQLRTTTTDRQALPHPALPTSTTAPSADHPTDHHHPQLRSARFGDLSAFGSDDMSPSSLQTYRIRSSNYPDATALPPNPTQLGARRPSRQNDPRSLNPDPLGDTPPAHHQPADDPGDTAAKKGSSSLVHSSEADGWATKATHLRWADDNPSRSFDQVRRSSAAPSPATHRAHANGNSLSSGRSRPGSSNDSKALFDASTQSANYLARRAHTNEQNQLNWSTNSRLSRMNELASPPARLPWPESLVTPKSPSPNGRHWRDNISPSDATASQGFAKPSGDDFSFNTRLARQKSLWNGQFGPSSSHSKGPPFDDRARTISADNLAKAKHSNVSASLTGYSDGDLVQTSSPLMMEKSGMQRGSLFNHADTISGRPRPYFDMGAQGDALGGNSRKHRQHSATDASEMNPFADQFASLQLDQNNSYWLQYQQHQQQQQQQHQQQQQQQRQQQALLLQQARATPQIGPQSADGGNVDLLSRGVRSQSPFARSHGDQFGGHEHMSQFPRLTPLEKERMRALMAEQSRNYPSAQGYEWPNYTHSSGMSAINSGLMNSYQSQYLPSGPSALQFGRAAAVPPALDTDVGQGVVSARLAEFHRSNIIKGGRRWELRDIYDHMIEFAGDQHGSRFIQQKLETANSDERHRVFQELYPNALQLMKDVFGNYVIQKFFEHGDQTQKKQLANCMKGQVLELSIQVYGCRVVQKALEYVLVDQQASLIKELENNVIKCVKDQNGNHVVQKAIERIPQQYIGFIVDAFIGQVQHLATHSFGCRVVQRLLEHAEEPARSMLLRELHECAPTLILDQYGNYVTQHVIQNGASADRDKLIQLVLTNFVTYAKQKFASNVVEKTIVHCKIEERRNILHQVCWKDERREERGDTVLSSMIRDGYGNYVIQRLLETLENEDYWTLVAALQPEIEKASQAGTNKQLENVKKKMERFGHHRNRQLTFGQYSMTRLSEGVESSVPTLSVTTDETSSPRTASLPGSTPSSAESCDTQGATPQPRTAAHTKGHVFNYE